MERSTRARKRGLFQPLFLSGTIRRGTTNKVLENDTVTVTAFSIDAMDMQWIWNGLMLGDSAKSHWTAEKDCSEFMDWTAVQFDSSRPPKWNGCKSILAVKWSTA
jgi:hypothetical protein